MATTADFKNGAFFLFNNHPCQLIYFQHVKPGKGNTIVRTKFKDLTNGKLLEYTYGAGERIDFITVERRPYQYLYKDDMGCNLMNNETFEQVSINPDLINGVKFMKEGDELEVVVHAESETILYADMPTHVIMEVTYTEPGLKGDTATNTLKPATVENGAEVRVPLFINAGDKIKIDTRDGSYVERVRE